MDQIERQREHFESISEKYYSSRQDQNHLLIKNLIWSTFFSQADYPIPRGPDPLGVIEPMCGYAEGREIICKHLTENIRYVGFDYSGVLVDLVRKKYPTINIIQQDVTRFSLPEGEAPYDLMILIGGLHHVYHNVDQVLKSLSTALKPGGYFINFEPTQNCFITKKVRDVLYKQNDFFDESTEKAFDLDELNRLYVKNNYSIIFQDYPGLLAYILYYNPDAFPSLNIGPKFLVNLIFRFDNILAKSWFGKKISFATLTLLKKIK